MMSKVKQLIDGNRAVSPVIGVILMVAVTVLLGAVVAGFTTGLGDDLNQNAPDAQIEFDYDNANSQLVVLHSGGDTLNPDNTQELRIANTNSGVAFNTSKPHYTTSGTPGQIDGTIEAGDTIASGSFNSGQSVDIVWVGPEGDSSATLAEYEGPAA